MTDIMIISDKVSGELFRHFERFYDTAALSAEDIIMITDAIVEAGIEVWENTYNAVFDTVEHIKNGDSK